RQGDEILGRLYRVGLPRGVRLRDPGSPRPADRGGMVHLGQHLGQRLLRPGRPLDPPLRPERQGNPLRHRAQDRRHVELRGPPVRTEGRRRANGPPRPPPAAVHVGGASGMAMNNLLLEARLTLRGLTRQPGFAVTVILTLAVGIGANLAFFGYASYFLAPTIEAPE